jgi:hypothetical protein
MTGTMLAMKIGLAYGTTPFLIAYIDRFALPSLDPHTSETKVRAFGNIPRVRFAKGVLDVSNPSVLLITGPILYIKNVDKVVIRNGNGSITAHCFLEEIVLG